MNRRESIQAIAASTLFPFIGFNSPKNNILPITLDEFGRIVEKSVMTVLDHRNDDPANLVISPNFTLKHWTNFIGSGLYTPMKLHPFENNYASKNNSFYFFCHKDYIEQNRKHWNFIGENSNLTTEDGSINEIGTIINIRGSRIKIFVLNKNVENKPFHAINQVRSSWPDDEYNFSDLSMTALITNEDFTEARCFLTDNFEERFYKNIEGTIKKGRNWLVFHPKKHDYDKILKIVGKFKNKFPFYAHCHGIHGITQFDERSQKIYEGWHTVLLHTKNWN